MCCFCSVSCVSFCLSTVFVESRPLKHQRLRMVSEVLSKPETRQIYDTYGEQGLEGMQNQGGHGGAGVDPFDIFSQVFGFNAGGLSVTTFGVEPSL